MDVNKKVRPSCLIVFFFPDSADFWHQVVARFKVDQVVYQSGTRGVEPDPYKVHKALGDGQYELSRDDKVVLNDDGKNPKIFLEENLQLEP